MANTQGDVVPPFWTEPWRWAAPAWHRRYGAPPGELDPYAARLLYGGWTACFGLPHRWRAPPDRRWLVLVQLSPPMLHRVTLMLGHLALIRAGLTRQLGRATKGDRWLACALRYRDANCLRAYFDPRSRDFPLPHSCGVSVLRAMAGQHWLEIDSRVAMLEEPDSRAGALPGDDTWAIESVDVSRCLALCCAVARWLAAQPAEAGER